MGYVSFREGKSKNCWLDFCWFLTLVLPWPCNLIDFSGTTGFPISSGNKNLRPAPKCWKEHTQNHLGVQDSDSLNFLHEKYFKAKSGGFWKESQLPSWNWNLLVMACWRLIVPSCKISPNVGFEKKGLQHLWSWLAPNASTSDFKELSPPKSGWPQVATLPLREIRANALAQRPDAPGHWAKIFRLLVKHHYNDRKADYDMVLKMYMGVSKNSGTSKWMVYSGKPKS